MKLWNLKRLYQKHRLTLDRIIATTSKHKHTFLSYKTKLVMRYQSQAIRKPYVVCDYELLVPKHSPKPDSNCAEDPLAAVNWLDGYLELGLSNNVTIIAIKFKDLK